MSLKKMKLKKKKKIKIKSKLMINLLKEEKGLEIDY